MFDPHRLPLAACLVLCLALAACGTPAKTVDPYGTQTITTVGDLDIQDAERAAAELSQSLLNSGVLGKGEEPSTIAISRYVNNTSVQIDRDRVVKKLRVSLNKAGVAQTYTTIGLGPVEDPLAAQYRQNTDDQWEARPRPDYTLSFKILQQRASKGKLKQNTFIFQMSLTNVNSGLAVWEDEVSITKQGSKPGLGW